jgi:hypothetical protein
MRLTTAALFLICVFCHSAPAQIIYQPVQYQYGAAAKFFYGGANPDIISYGYAQPSAGPAQLTIYSDARPYENLAIYGYTVSDARDEAYANVPRYFRKRDLLATAQAAPDGTLVVGSQSQPIPTAPSSDQHSISAPLILIIPRGQTLPPPPKSNNVIINVIRR